MFILKMIIDKISTHFVLINYQCWLNC